MEEKRFALLMLAITAIVGLIGLIILFTMGSTGAAAKGTCWYAGGHVQCTPEGACARMYGDACEPAQIEKGSTPYEERDGVLQVQCKCPTGYVPPNDYKYVWAPMLQKYP